MLKCVASSNLNDANREKIYEACRPYGGIDLHCLSERKELDAAIDSALDSEIIFGFAQAPRSRMSELLEKTQTLRWIQTYGAGIDNIPLELAESKNIRITNASGANAVTISEHVLMLILAIYRNLRALEDHRREHLWKWSRIERISGLRLTIVGTGAIGSEIAYRAAAFGLVVTGVSRSGSPAVGFDHVHATSRLLDVLSETDILVVACPLTEETLGLIGEDELRVLPSGATLVDISRGGVVTEKALLQVLEDGQLRGVGRDVFEDEPLPAQSLWWDLDNVYVTPHIAGNQSDHVDKCVDIFSENLSRYLSEKPLVNSISYSKGY